MVTFHESLQLLGVPHGRKALPVHLWTHDELGAQVIHGVPALMEGSAHGTLGESESPWTKNQSIWGVSTVMGVPKNRWFQGRSHLQMDDLGHINQGYQKDSYAYMSCIKT